MTTEVTAQEISTFNINHTQSSISPQNHQTHNNNSPITFTESDNESNFESNQLLSIELQMDHMLSSIKDIKCGESCPIIEIDNNQFQLYPEGKDSKKAGLAEIYIFSKDPAVTKCGLPSITCDVSVVLPDETIPAVGIDTVDLDKQRESIDAGDGISFNVPLPRWHDPRIETASTMTIKVVLLTDPPQIDDGPIESLNCIVQGLAMNVDYNKKDLQKTGERLDQLVKHLKDAHKEIKGFGKVQSQSRSKHC